MPRKREFSLCAGLAVTVGVYLSLVRPTLERYYLFTIPFLSILALAGLSAAALKLYRADRPWLPVVPMALLLGFGLAKSLYDERDNLAWSDLEQTARKVSELITPQQALFADEASVFWGPLGK